MFLPKPLGGRILGGPGVTEPSLRGAVAACAPLRPWMRPNEVEHGDSLVNRLLIRLISLASRGPAAGRRPRFSKL